MFSARNGSSITITHQGPIGETTEFFSVPLEGIKEITLDLKGMTFMNSIGVKHWIIWTLRIPSAAVVKLINCPFMMASQASTVVGFLPKNLIISSIKLPYACEGCGFEYLHLAVLGKDFDYANEGRPALIKVPKEIPCPKCKEADLAPDFFNDKTFKFLG